ncbi:MAG TPA: FkbM family methyltransferase [Ktedonobacterales bacterium]|nr:FkbM family methyltransferase [Ktedonobacterales bacterium]
MAKKYCLVALHATGLRRFKLGRSAMRLRGRRVYYESSLGFADYQSILTRHELMVSECQLQDGGAFVDLGANVGYFTLLLAERFPHARIIAFEPVCLTFQCLRRNTVGFSNVEAHNMAVSNFAGNAFMRFDELESQTSQLTSSPTTEAVEVDTLDHALRDRGVTHVDLLKIDVENAEKFVLQGAQTTLTNTRYLLIEINISDNPNYTFTDLVSLLNSDTYNFQLIALRNFSNVAEGRISVGDFLFENVLYRPDEERH